MTARRVFIAGSHTDIGKTHVACGLIAAARAAGLTTDAVKPIASGFDAADWARSDPGRLLAALGRPLTPAMLDAIIPWRFAAPLAPPMAAHQGGRTLPFAPVAQFCATRLATSDADLFVVEGIGGVMSPLADAATCLDLQLALGIGALLVGGSYLGAMSHTLTALEVLRARGQAVVAIVVSQDAKPDAPDFAASVAMLGAHAGTTPVLAAARDGDTAWATQALALLT